MLRSFALSDDAIAIATARHRDPFAVLGMHREDDDLVVRAFLPQANRVEVVDAARNRVAGELERVDPSGFFAGGVGRGAPFPYRLRVHDADGVRDIEDPYRFPPVLGEIDMYLFVEGTHRKLWEKLGAHSATVEGVAGVLFAVWAPNARSAAVVGDFNRWDGRVSPMRLRLEAGLWELFVPGVPVGACYKYELRSQSGDLLPLKADPLAAGAELRPATASRVVSDAPFAWTDAAWMSRRAAAQAADAPVSVYEVHLGSWKRGKNDRFLTYRELADDLIPYVVDLGYTHLELMPVNEHPFDGSWGYQPTGLFAPTSRFGSPQDFAYFVDRAHAVGLGLLVDWVPGHFPTDAFGLGDFDGTHLYEHADPRQGFHPDWNTYVYNFGRSEVQNFIVNSGLVWLERYHVDGLRVDAVASMLYLDYSRKAGEWVPNEFGGRENLGAVALLRRMNALAAAEAGTAGTVMIAEESTSWPKVSGAIADGGLGFDFKWNMGWMHDTLEYMAEDPINRKFHHDKMTFGLVYAWSEKFVLPLSHDEVVHGKGSILAKMPGDAWQKFANVRAYYGFMFGHPGKKLLFMGSEFAQGREWNHDASLDWHQLREYPGHAGVQALVRDLNGLYRATPALYELDCEPAGFAWIEGGDAERSVFSFERRARDGSAVLVVANFTPVPRDGYRIGVPCAGRYVERLNTDHVRYGGSGVGTPSVSSEPISAHGREHSILLHVPPLGTVFLTLESE